MTEILGFGQFRAVSIKPTPVQSGGFGQFSTALVVLRLLQSSAGYAIACSIWQAKSAKELEACNFLMGI